MTPVHQRSTNPARARSVWLSLDESTDVEVPYLDAVAWTADDFAQLYRKTVYGSSKSDAETWGERQVRERDAALAGVPHDGF